MRDHGKKQNTHEIYSMIELMIEFIERACYMTATYQYRNICRKIPIKDTYMPPEINFLEVFFIRTLPESASSSCHTQRESDKDTFEMQGHTCVFVCLRTTGSVLLLQGYSCFLSTNDKERKDKRSSIQKNCALLCKRAHTLSLPPALSK